jgi:nitrogen-specific signal transduction histidine kinase
MIDGLAHVLDVASDACSLLTRDQRPAIELHVDGRPGGLAIVVSENGAAIPEEAVREAFDSPLHGGAPAGGTSLALFLARSALSAGGGDLLLTSGEGWTRFEIPLAPVTGARRQEANGRTPGPPDLRVIPGSGAAPLRLESIGIAARRASAQVRMARAA